MADEYGVVNGRIQKTFSGAADEGAGARGQAAVDADEKDRKRSTLIATKSTTGVGPMPKLSDFGGDMSAFGTALRQYRNKADAAPENVAQKSALTRMK